MTSVEEWKRKIAPKVLKDIGFSTGHTIVDFGCGTGIYDLVISEIIGLNGKIYAIDSNEEGLLPQLIDDIKKFKLENIEVIETSGDFNFPIEDYIVDIVLLYDVMHLIEEEERELLIKETSRVLKKEGIISYHATHIRKKNDDFVIGIRDLMKNAGFCLIETFQRPMFHWSWIQDSWVFNYQRPL